MKKPLSWLISALAIVAVAALVFTPMGCPTPAATAGQAGPLGVVALDITQTAATITWNTDVEATSQVQYGETTAYSSITPFDEDLDTSHSVTLTGLSPGTTYHFRVISEDASGNLIASSDYTFAALPPETLPVEGTIAFASDRDGDVEIYLMNANGTCQTRFTWKPGRDDGPSLLKLPDLSYQVAFSSMASHYSKAAKAFMPTIDVFKMDADGSNKTNVSNVYGPDRTPSWSADGSKIVYSHVRKLNSAIFVINADGSGEVQLTGYPEYIGNYSDPTMSPDGTKIAYVNTVYIDPDTGDEVAHDAEIYVMEDDGSDWGNKYDVATYTHINLTDNPAEDLSPAWSPDGTKILFASNRDGDMEIYVMDADGTNVTNLTNNEVSDTAPCWSPDGNYIAFVSSRDGNAEIYVMKADGTNQARVTYNDASDGDPSWGP